MSALVVVTRDDPREEEAAAEARSPAHETLRLSLLGTEPGPDREALRSWLRNRPARAALAWTSRRAAEALLEIAPSEDALRAIPLFALGRASARPARDAGYVVHDPGATRPSAAQLARYLLDRRTALGIDRVAFLRGNRSLPGFPAALLEAGVPVDSFEIYRTEFLSPDVSRLVRALESREPVTLQFHSPSGIEALERLLGPELIPALRRQAAAPLGDTTRKALVARGYTRIVPLTQTS